MSTDRKKWEREVLTRVLETVPVSTETVDFIACVATAMIETRPDEGSS